MDYLTVKEFAELKGCKPQYIQKSVKDGKLEAIQDINPQNKKPQYLIPVSALPAELQARYYKQIKLDTGIAPELKTPLKQHKKSVKKTFEEYSESERREITFWCHLLEEWQNVRAVHRNKTQVDPKFVAKCQLEHPDISISVDILYRKYTAYKNNDYDGLVDKRGGWNKGTSSIPESVWDAFLTYYLDQNKLTVSRCYDLTKEWTAEFSPELYDNLPTERSFRRHIQNDINTAVLTLCRDGEKAFADRCLPYVTRMYDKLQANDCWIADNHTFDVQSINGDGQIHRLHLTAFLDAKSGVMVGWNVTDNPCSQSTILALRHGILRCGIPKSVYFDNGSEFLTHDVGGRGHRTRKNMVEDPPTILQRLGIEMRNALVRNAKAKPIERTFYTLKQQFSRAMEGFCGGTILERPENLKRRIKNGQIPMDFELREYIDQWIDGDYNLQAYGGSESLYKGKSRIDVWNSTIQSIRMAEESDLNLMLMRSTRYQKVKRNGVYVDIYGQKLWYMLPEETYKYLDDEVYVRYDPAMLTSVRLYDKNDKYLCTWPLADELMIEYLSTNKDEISDAMATQRRVKRLVAQDAQALTAGLSNSQRLSILDATIRKAQRNISGCEFKLPTNIIPVVLSEEPITLPAAVGAEPVEINVKKMYQNAEKRKEG